MNMIRKGQIRWQAKGDITGQVHYIEQISELLPNRSIPLTPTRLSKPICDRSAIAPSKFAYHSLSRRSRHRMIRRSSIGFGSGG
jgi:hypothetical protein